MKLVCGALLLIVASAPLLASASRATGTTRSPKVEKVIELLKALQSNLEADDKKEQQMYDRYACWCETITHQKATAIIAAKEQLRELGQEILTLKGRVATLNAEIAQLLVDIEDNQKAQETATAIRQKENEAFQAESLELAQALAALEKCIAILVEATMPLGETMPEGGIQTISLTQMESKAKLASQRLQDAIAASPLAALGGMRSSKLSLLKSYASQLSQGKAGYTPQSLTIQGILKEMYATFAEDLQSKMEDEAQRNTLFEDLIATKQKELLDMQESVKKKTEEKAEAEVMLAEAVQAYDDIEAQMNHDIAFFDVTKEACANTADEWADRKAYREEELEGIKKAIEILDNDDARQLFDDAIKDGHQGHHGITNLFQVASSNDASAPARLAFNVLKAKASGVHSLRLARVAVKIAEAKAGHFDIVIKAIDKMIYDIDITEEQEDERKIDQCKDQYTQINATKADLTWKIGKNTAKIDKLTILIRGMQKELVQTVAKIDETEQLVIGMNATRKQENQDYLDAKDDDNEAIDLLQQARDALASYYDNKSVEGMETVTVGGEGRMTMLLQEGTSTVTSGKAPVFDISDEQAPEVVFSGKGHRKGEAKGVLSIIDNIIEDLRGELALSRKEEAAAQLEHEKQVGAAHALIESLEERKVNLKTNIQDKKKDKLDEEKTRRNHQKDLQEERDYYRKIKPDCDWIIDNAPERRAKRRAEIDGLNAAKAYLVGYQEKSELGQEIGASQAGLLQATKSSPPAASASMLEQQGGQKEAVATQDLNKLATKENMLKGIVSREEAMFAERQKGYKPLAMKGALLQTDNHATAEQSQAEMDRLAKKENMLRSIASQEETAFAERQKNYKPMAKKGAALVQTVNHAAAEQTQAEMEKLAKKEKILKSIANQEEAAFAERQKEYKPLAKKGAALVQTVNHATAEQTQAEVENLAKKENMLKGIVGHEEAMFAERQKSYKQVANKDSALLQTGSDVTAEQTQAEMENLAKKENMLRDIASRDETIFAERQKSYKPLKKKVAFLQTDNHATAEQTEAEMEKLAEKEKTLKGIAGKEEAMLAERQKNYKPLAKKGAALVQTVNHATAEQTQAKMDKLAKEENMLKSIASQEEAAFAERQKNYKPLAKKGAALVQTVNHATAEQTQAEMEKLAKKENMLKSIVSQEEAAFAERQKEYKPLAKKSSLLQTGNHASEEQTQADIEKLMRKEKILQGMTNEDEAMLADRQKNYKPLVRGAR